MNEPSTQRVQSVIITGGASGIGLAVAQMTLARGGCVGVVDLEAGQVDELVRQYPKRVSFQRGSVLDEGFLKAAWSVFEQALPEPVNGLVNCAGMPPLPLAIEALDVSEWSRILDSHLNGTFIPCKVFGSEIAQSGRGGAVVNLASVLSYRPGPVLAYGAAKSGVVNLTAALAVHWAARQVRVNAVAPGWTDTPFLRPKGRGTRDFTPILEATPQHRLMQPSEIAEVICFLLSPAASAVTGSTIPCDGGVIAGSGWPPYGGFGASRPALQPID